MPGVVMRDFEWTEWDMMIQKDDVSEIYVPGKGSSQIRGRLISLIIKNKFILIVEAP